MREMMVHSPVSHLLILHPAVAVEAADQAVVQAAEAPAADVVGAINKVMTAN